MHKLDQLPPLPGLPFHPIVLLKGNHQGLHRLQWGAGIHLPPQDHSPEILQGQAPLQHRGAVLGDCRPGHLFQDDGPIALQPGDQPLLVVGGALKFPALGVAQLVQGLEGVPALRAAVHIDQRPACVTGPALSLDVKHPGVGQPLRRDVGRDTGILPVDGPALAVVPAQEVLEPFPVIRVVAQLRAGG